MVEHSSLSLQWVYCSSMTDNARSENWVPESQVSLEVLQKLYPDLYPIRYKPLLSRVQPKVDGRGKTNVHIVSYWCETHVFHINGQATATPELSVVAFQFLVLDDRLFLSLDYRYHHWISVMGQTDFHRNICQIQMSSSEVHPWAQWPSGHCNDEVERTVTGWLIILRRIHILLYKYSHMCDDKIDNIWDTEPASGFVHWQIIVTVLTGLIGLSDIIMCHDIAGQKGYVCVRSGHI